MPKDKPLLKMLLNEALRQYSKETGDKDFTVTSILKLNKNGWSDVIVLENNETIPDMMNVPVDVMKFPYRECSVRLYNILKFNGVRICDFAILEENEVSRIEKYLFGPKMKEEMNNILERHEIKKGQILSLNQPNSKQPIIQISKEELLKRREELKSRFSL